MEMCILFIYRISHEGKCMNEVKIGGIGRYLIAFVSVITTLVLPVVVILYVYGYIIWTLRTNKFKLSMKIQQSVRDAFKAMTIVSVTYTICWTPDMVLYFVTTFVTPSDWEGNFYQWALVLAGSNV
ncbi:hypothetical protein HOLleu_07443 [Holothuria leucospilota]|uniref:G-protein coupled receptors family 1 profile domain-containing protein n=1 Tax=Holothuria leucospilota TaxID=206669 RepID=A0A9Q1CG03_HOLLE|nr:hypothetical protein HOLleu_07443 [Holothuria leucospilota]